MYRTISLLIALLIPGLGTAQEVAFDDIEDVPVWGIQLMVGTSYTAAHGDTDDRVDVTLHGTPVSPGQHFGLDRGGDDREIGSRNTYGVFLPDVATIGDIDMLMLEKHGTDMWCIDRLEMQINPGHDYDYMPILSMEFGANGHCIDADDGLSPRLVITGEELRSSPYWTLDWQSRIGELPQSVTFFNLAARIESAGGDGMSNDPDVHYGDKDGSFYVEVYGCDEYFADVSMDLVRPWNLDWFEEEWDFETELGVECIDGEFLVSLEPDKGGVFNQSFWRFERTFERLNDLAGDDYKCADVWVDGNGSIQFDWIEVDDGFGFPSYPWGGNVFNGSWGFAP